MAEHKVGDRVIVTLFGTVCDPTLVGANRETRCSVAIDELGTGPLIVDAEDVHAFDLDEPDVLLGTDADAFVPPSQPGGGGDGSRSSATITAIRPVPHGTSDGANGSRRAPGGRVWGLVPFRGKRVDWIDLARQCREDHDLAFFVARPSAVAARLAKRDSLAGLGVESEVVGSAVIVYAS